MKQYLILMLCFFTATAGAQNSTEIVVIVKDQRTMQVLQDAKVEIHGEVTESRPTEQDGTCIFMGVKVGFYHVEVSAPGYWSTSHKIEATSGSFTQVMLLQPLPKYTVSGYITQEPFGQPVKGASVFVQIEGTQRLDSTRSNATGYYNFTFEKEGSRDIEIRKYSVHVVKETMQVVEPEEHVRYGYFDPNNPDDLEMHFKLRKLPEAPTEEAAPVTPTAVPDTVSQPVLQPEEPAIVEQAQRKKRQPAADGQRRIHVLATLSTARSLGIHVGYSGSVTPFVSLFSSRWFYPQPDRWLVGNREAIQNYQGAGYYVIGSQSFDVQGAAVAGLACTIAPSFACYAGAGYGSRQRWWQATEFDYGNDDAIGIVAVKAQERSASGLALQLGIMQRIRIGTTHWLVSANIYNIGLEATAIDLNLGIGYAFGKK